MQFFYEGAIRKYLGQTIRVFSNFVVRYGDGTLVPIPVVYGDADRQVSNIINQNSENSINSAPKISVTVASLELDRDRLADASYVGKMQIRERALDPITNLYTPEEGRNYTVERMMPTPYKLTMKVDIWSTSTEQKLQILEQILVLFNPSLEIQKSDNWLDWTSLSVLELVSVNWSSRSVPVGNDSPIDISSLTVSAPIWISPPVKVKHQGIITKIIANLWGTSYNSPSGYIEGLGVDTADSTTVFSDLMTTEKITISGFNVLVSGSQVQLLNPGDSYEYSLNGLDPVTVVNPVNWLEAFAPYPGKYIAGGSMIYLTQSNNSTLIGNISVNSINPTLLDVTWNPDTLPKNTGIDSNGLFDFDPGYNASASYRPNSPGTVDKVINPLQYNPDNFTKVPGTRYLLTDDIGSSANTSGATGWRSTTGVDLIAHKNDIIEWTGTQWNVIFNAATLVDVVCWQTDISTEIQYRWNSKMWTVSYEGTYVKGNWSLVL